MLILEKLTENTCQLLRRWRNQNKEYFVEQHLITHKEQEIWFKKYLINEKFHVFIVYEHEKQIGSIGLSIISKEEAQIELLILGDKEYADQGIMSAALTKMMEAFPYKKYRLLVRKDNILGQSFYKKNGFAMDKEDEKCYIMTKYLDLESSIL